MSEAPQAMRLDKWLWAARFFKTRALAVEAIERHRVQVNALACKPSREVRAGDRIRLQQPGWWREVLVQGLSPYRGPAPQAQLLYQDTPDSLREAAVAAERRQLSPEPASSLSQGRPTKRDRRQIDALDQSPVDWDRWSASLPPER